MENRDKFVKHSDVKIEPTEAQIKAYLILRNRRALRKLREKGLKEQEEKKSQSNNEQPD